MRLVKFTRQAPVAILAITLAGCVSYPIVGGHPSVLSSDAVGLRTTVVTATPLGRRPAYQPVPSCRYQQEIYRGGRLADSSVVKVEVAKARERLLITWRDGGEPSTAIIGRDGKLFSYNFMSRINGERWNSDNAQRKYAELRASSPPGMRWLNEIEVYYPTWVARGSNPGSTLGVVHDDTGAVWGEFVYQGKASVKGQRGILADFIRRNPNNGRPYNYGFAVFDQVTFAPLVVITGTPYRDATQVSSVRIWRLGCP